MDISIRAAGIALRLNRFAERRECPSDAEAIRELGEHLERLCEQGFKYTDQEDRHPILAGLVSDGPYLALRIEKEYLQGKEFPEKLDPIRKLGVTTLDKLAKVLQQAGTPDFERYAKPLDELFTAWQAYAEELSIPKTSYGFVGGGGMAPAEIIGELMYRFPSK